MYGRALVIANWTAHWQRAAKVPEKFRSAPGKISAETIQGIPLRPKDQLERTYHISNQDFPVNSTLFDAFELTR